MGPETASAIELDPKVADIMVACPLPEHQLEGSQRVADFMQTEIGQRVLTPLIENFKELRGMGLDDEKAANMAFAAVAVRDESGSLVRTEAAEEMSNTDRIDDSQVVSSEPKKKF